MPGQRSSLTVDLGFLPERASLLVALGDAVQRGGRPLVRRALGAFDPDAGGRRRLGCGARRGSITYIDEHADVCAASLKPGLQSDTRPET
jgi:hypothetical protein